MRFDGWTLALQTVNFAILVWLLRRFLYQPVLRAIDARRTELEAQRAEAARIEAEAKNHLAAVEAARAGIAVERMAVLKSATAQAEEAAAARRAQAQHEAAMLLDDARKTLAAEREQVLTEAHRAALNLGIEIARRVLAEMPVALRAEAWLTQIEQFLAGLTPARREELQRGANGSSTLRVLTAVALPEAVATEWRVRLHRALSPNLAMVFETDPALVAGVELHFPQAILRFSWRSVLDTLKTEIADHDHAG